MSIDIGALGYVGGTPLPQIPTLQPKVGMVKCAAVRRSPPPQVGAVCAIISVLVKGDVPFCCVSGFSHTTRHRLFGLLNRCRTRYITVSMLPCFTACSPMRLLPTKHATLTGGHDMQAPLHGDQPYSIAKHVSMASGSMSSASASRVCSSHVYSTAGEA